MAFERFSLENKTALITGGAGLLGAEHALALLESGARVILTDINQTALFAAHSQLLNFENSKKITIKKMDVSNIANVTSVANSLLEDGIEIDILINNAAIDPKVKGNIGIVETSRIENYAIEQWDSQIAVGLTGAFICSKVFGSLMASRLGGGVILNIASDLSVISPDQRLYRKSELPKELQPVKPASYSVIKAGIIGLTRYLATYWCDDGVRCNALSPGGIENGQSEEFILRLASLIPLGRMASVDEYRSAIQFLCSDASSYMNGQNIIMDGGRSVW